MVKEMGQRQSQGALCCGTARERDIAECEVLQTTRDSVGTGVQL